jgi:hypothetical protein
MRQPDNLRNKIYLLIQVVVKERVLALDKKMRKSPPKWKIVYYTKPPLFLIENLGFVRIFQSPSMLSNCKCLGVPPSNICLINLDYVSNVHRGGVQNQVMFELLF